MAYVKQDWENLPAKTTPISAARLAHMETQYDEAAALVDSSVGGLDDKISQVSNDFPLVSQNISDFTDRVEAILNVPARPINNLWPQGFCYDGETGTYFIVYTGNVDSQYNVRIYNYDSSGVLLDSKTVRGLGVNQDIPLTSSESLPMWRDSGQLKFLLSAGTSGRGRAVYNWTSEVLGPEFQVLGGYRGEFDGGFYVTPNSVDSVNGVSQVYLYDADSIKNSSPGTPRTLHLQTRNSRRKLQGFSSTEGTLVGLTGAAGETPGLISWDASGNQGPSFEFVRSSLGEVVNGEFPGTISDLNNFHTEAEGSYSDPEVGYLFGSVINNGSTARFVIFRTGDPRSERVPVIPDSDAIDTGWITLPIVATDFYEPWSSTRPGIQVRRIGMIVFIRGEIRTLQASWSGQTIADLRNSLPGLVPSLALNSVQQGSGTSNYTLTVNSVGVISLGRAQSASTGAGVFLSIGACYSVE